ncbi:MobF family relaxase [Leekyejoonella antrihumi]|uniref:MobF family relaxase n=1 Tax=Leekyejoonella antrihumi TaxID=1660198 RepID=UPI0016493706|nr:MobF family relaxase [Leekyejoonella antrihumi]
MTGSIHKLTAGSGYAYLTRQVAAHDSTGRGHMALASYYTERGETPGRWVGRGMAAIDGLGVGDEVTASQMQSLFGHGHHPLAKQADAVAAGLDPNLVPALRLGQPYKVYAHDATPFQQEVARRFVAFNQDAGLPWDQAVPPPERARIRSQVAAQFFRDEHGRDATGARELAGEIAKNTRAKTTAVAGYDLTFSPVKSVSTLWAVAGPPLAARIELAHHGAVSDALAFIEDHALYTREGGNGVRQVDVQGLVATAFTHRDSRAGDPDLHTHVAVANKVATLAGKWLSIDGRVLFKAMVSASEVYNTALERRLIDTLGVRFAERPTDTPNTGDPGGTTSRPVREIVGVNPQLNARWSARRAAINTRRAQLAVCFQADHGRPPTPVEAIQLAQQATLETREAKHEPRTLAQQRAAWARDATDELGSPDAVQAMVKAAVPARSPENRQNRQNHARAPEHAPSRRWVKQTAHSVVTTVEGHRSHWQTWHVRAEALRRVRSAGIPTEHVDAAVEAIVRTALDRFSVRLDRPADGLIEPPILRRTDGASVYEVAGSQQYTSKRVLAAEQRLVAAAGRDDGHTVSDADVALAVLEQEANGVTLNAGQSSLVTAMSTSGARVQVAIAPAGSGKTTAMHALTRAWTGSGGQVLGLAPSAAAATVLRDRIQVHTDTLAKLISTLNVPPGRRPAWVNQIDETTLVLIDEAAMADTISLDRAVTYLLGRGASVRLIGDDQQLAAIGAGGVLRDITATHGGLHLSEVMRFADPGEGAASLAFRAGRTEALGFYLDHDRVHVGDLSAMTEQVFTAWATDRAHGLDSIMLAPTRDLVGQLNQRARTHRLANQSTNHPAHHSCRPERVVRLADGQDASAGDTIITRRNDRRLRVTATDWVKNGDRWRILDTDPQRGTLRVKHLRHGRILTLPRAYVTAFTELGYAATINTAQGITTDTGHTLFAGTEARQQGYTALTRGRLGNHLYLQVVGDGDPHTLIHPSLTHPDTPTDLLQGMLARDAAPISATTHRRTQQDPAVRLGPATDRYTDALHVAAEDLLGANAVRQLEHAADEIVPGVTGQPAWDALRAHLILITATGADPTRALSLAAASRELETAEDTAAVLDWRLNSPAESGAGPLPWLPAVPAALATHPSWGPYLRRRAALVADLAHQVTTHATDGPTPDWTVAHGGHLEPGVLAEVQVWRAATQTPDTDLRPTGRVQLSRAAYQWQQHLRDQLAASMPEAMAEWALPLHRISPDILADDYAGQLAQCLAAISRAGLNAAHLLAQAANAGPLPDDHAAAALWWRIAGRLSPATLHHTQDHALLVTAWIPQLPGLLGTDLAQQVQDSPHWPALVATIDHALHRGHTLPQLLTLPAGYEPDPASVDLCDALTWRISILLDPPSEPDQPDETFDGQPFDDESPHDVGQQPDGLSDASSPGTRPAQWPNTPAIPTLPPPGDPAPASADQVLDAMAAAARSRQLSDPIEPSDAEINRVVQWAYEADTADVSPERIADLNAAALRFYENQLQQPGNWARAYLCDRFGQDLAGHPDYQPGYAPAGWTRLVHHLRDEGASDQELLESGLAITNDRGHLRDRFVDRQVFPIIANGQVLGFVGRRRPELSDTDRRGPKYLNTADTVLFHKRAQLFGIIPRLLNTAAIPVLVEGPMDAIAVTLASDGTYVGVAPLGTTLSHEQATQLAHAHPSPIIATDADPAGQHAAEIDYWLLATHQLDPLVAAFPTGQDPAGLLATRGRDALNHALACAIALGQTLVNERLTNLPRTHAARAAAEVIAAMPPHRWDPAITQVADRLHLATRTMQRQTLFAIGAWNADPAAAADARRAGEVLKRLKDAAAAAPAQRWALLAEQIDQRLTRQPDWPALARGFHRVRVAECVA